VVFSVLLHGVNELLSSSSQEGNPRGAGVDTSFHNLERKRWSRGGRNGEGREMGESRRRGEKLGMEKTQKK